MKSINDIKEMAAGLHASSPTMQRIYYNIGRMAARDLRENACGMTGTEVIDAEIDIPDFDPKKDYAKWPAGGPVKDGGQVYKLLQPYNAAHYDGRPADLPALWGVLHTTNPDMAKPWVAPLGTSGMYMQDECYTDGVTVWRAKRDNLVHDAAALPAAWEEVNGL